MLTLWQKEQYKSRERSQFSCPTFLFASRIACSPLSSQILPKRVEKSLPKDTVSRCSHDENTPPPRCSTHEDRIQPAGPSDSKIKLCSHCWLQSMMLVLPSQPEKPWRTSCVPNFRSDLSFPGLGILWRLDGKEERTEMEPGSILGPRRVDQLSQMAWIWQIPKFSLPRTVLP